MLSADWYCAKARAIAVGLSARRQQIEADILQRAPAGADGIRAVGLANGKPLVDREQCAGRAARRSSGANACARRRSRPDRRRLPISRAMSASLGGVSASATKAGSSVVSARIAASASIRPLSLLVFLPPRMAATFMSRMRSANVCSACQRLNGSESCAARCCRSSADRLATSLIGAEKPRLIDRTGSFRNVRKLDRRGWLTTGSRRRARRAARFGFERSIARRRGRPGRARAGSPSAP